MVGLGQSSLVRRIKTKTRKAKELPADFIRPPLKKMRKNAVNEEPMTSGFVDEQICCVDDFDDPITKMPTRARVYQRLAEADQKLLHKLDDHGGSKVSFVCLKFFFFPDIQLCLK